MNHRCATHIGSVLALASVAGCNKPPEPPPPVIHAVIASGDSRPGSGLGSFATHTSLEPAAEDRTHKRDAFGVGIRPGHGASGIRP